jgi:hypothetical protein
MTDRELLELAAKAAGIEIDHWRDHPMINICEYDRGEYRMWNPLTDDGDAFRLAVKLGIAWSDDYRYPDGERVAVISCAFGDTLYGDSVLMGNDPLAATRRAIVRAAAEIGRKMK